MYNVYISSYIPNIHSHSTHIKKIISVNIKVVPMRHNEEGFTSLIFFFFFVKINYVTL